jgi:hypothetical protein
MLPTDEGFDFAEAADCGKRCGKYLVGAMSYDEVLALRSSLASATNDMCFVERHVCGVDDLSTITDMDLLAAAKWSCECPRTKVSPEAQLVALLRMHGIPRQFVSRYEADTYRNGMLAALKEHLAKRRTT